MADDAKTPNEPFLQRWARRKAEAASADPVPAPPEVETASLDTASPAPVPTDTDGEPSEVDLSALPDIDSLDERSDFSVFMQNGIPDELRTRALQRLWRLDPSFGHVDGLLDYAEDFTGTGLAAEAVNTIYKVGKGMLSDDAEAAAEAEARADADAATVPAADEAAAGDAATSAPLPENDRAPETGGEDSPKDPDKAG